MSTSAPVPPSTQAACASDHRIAFRILLTLLRRSTTCRNGWDANRWVHQKKHQDSVSRCLGVSRSVGPPEGGHYDGYSTSPAARGLFEDVENFRRQLRVRLVEALLEVPLPVFCPRAAVVVDVARIARRQL